MKRSADQQPARLSDHAAFFSYRWLAWAVAALALTLPGRPVATLPRDAGLLLLCAVLTVVATALAQSYVRLARQRPALLMLDMAAGAAVLWLSGSTHLPFLPYALASLVLPSLLFGWRGALYGAGAFIVLDLVGLTLLNPGALGGAALLWRPLAALAFALLWAAVGRLAWRAAPARAEAGAGGPEEVAGDLLGRPDEASPGALRAIRALERPHAEPQAPAQPMAGGPLVLLRAATEQRADAARRVLYDLNPSHDQSLPSSLEQLGAAAARQGDLAVHVSCSGAPRPLSLAQHSVLLRVAHEALLNVQQHARAHNATLTLAYEPDAVTLVVCDDGVGLLDGTYERPGLHALRAVRYRLAELDGQLAVFEGEGGGVTVRATLPLEH